MIVIEIMGWITLAILVLFALTALIVWIWATVAVMRDVYRPRTKK